MPEIAAPPENSAKPWLDLSIVIPAHRDPALKKCLESIDANVEVVVALNAPTPEVEEIARRAGVVAPRMEEAHLSKAYNLGIHAASRSNVLLMDSDCVFLPGTIERLYQALEGHHLAKGRVLFSYKGWLSKVVARARHVHTVKPNAYSPPLAFRKSIVEHLGGYYFDPDLPWTEDFDFDARVQRAKLSLKYDDAARIVHPALSPIQDLRSSRRYGQGHGCGVQKGLPWYRPPRVSVRGLVAMVNRIRKKYGSATAIYLGFWQVSFYQGYKSRVKS